MECLVDDARVFIQLCKEDLRNVRSWNILDSSSQVSLSSVNSFIQFSKFSYPSTTVTTDDSTYIKCGYSYGGGLHSIFVELKENTLTIHPDQTGAMVLYYFDTSEYFYASNNFLTLINHIPMSELPSPNIPMIVEHLMWTSTISDETVIKNIFVLNENSRLEVTYGATIKKYLTAQYHSSLVTIEDNKILPTFIALLDESLHRFLPNIVEKNIIGSGLSGGMDSSTIAHRLLQLVSESLPLFSLIQPHPQYDQQITRLKDFVTSFGGQLNPVFVDEHRFMTQRPSPYSWDSVNPYLEIYQEPTVALAKKSNDVGVQVLFTGFGGDELFKVDEYEEVGFQGTAVMIERKQEHKPIFFTDHLFEVYAHSPVIQSGYPLPLIPHSLRFAQRVYNPLFHHQNIWPIAPLGYPPLIEFTRSLSFHWREKKKLLYEYQVNNSFPASYLNLNSQEFFTQTFEQGMRWYAQHYIHELLENSILARYELIDPQAILTEYQENGLAYRNKTRLCKYLYPIIELELLLRPYEKKRRGGEVHDARSNNIRAEAHRP